MFINSSYTTPLSPCFNITDGLLANIKFFCKHGPDFSIAKPLAYFQNLLIGQLATSMVLASFKQFWVRSRSIFIPIKTLLRMLVHVMIFATNFFHHLGMKSRIVILASRISPFINTITNIICMRSCPQVHGVATKRDVASVANNNAFRNKTKENFKCKTVGPSSYEIDLQAAISILRSWADPYPARIVPVPKYKVSKKFKFSFFNIHSERVFMRNKNVWQFFLNGSEL